jgi:hypothetical protein
MEFRLEQSRDSPSLSVDITLRFASDKDEVAFRNDLSDLNEIRRAIAEAQERILNPSLPGLSGRGTTAAPGDSARTFSEDCVCVFAKGPNMPDLYFYDIPGRSRCFSIARPLIVVQGVIEDVSDGQDPTQIGLIKNLVKKYVSKPNCIVLLVVSCECACVEGRLDYH